MLLTVPVAAGLAPLVLAAVPESRQSPERRGMDLPGALALTAGLGTLIFGLMRIESDGIASPTVLGSLAFSGMSLLALARIERRSSDPVLPLTVLLDPMLRSANTANMLKSTVGMAQLYVLTLFLQDILGASPVRTGMLFVPMALASVAGANIAGRLHDPLGGTRATALLGCVTLFGGLALLGTQLHRGASLVGVITAMMLIEGGFMVAEVPLNLAAATSLPHHPGLAAGVLNTTTELGNALGLGITAAIVGLRADALHELPPDEALAGGLRWGLGVAMTEALLAGAVVFTGLRERRP